MNYLELLENSYAIAQGNECPPPSRLSFLGGGVFDFTTYDSAMDEMFAARAVEVCAAISDRKTFEYIADPTRYQWYLLMVNMPFFAGKLSWGGSIRGAWWDHGACKFQVQSCGLWIGDEQWLDPLFDEAQWVQFIASVLEFAKQP